MSLRLTLAVAALCAIGAAIAINLGGLPLELATIRARVFAPVQVARPRASSDKPVRVTVAQVKSGDVPIYLTSIGTVQAYNTVNVKSRVDGEIVKIQFQEGQDVNVGDPLVIIDPRPYEAQLHQQEATRLKDQALLDSAILDLNRYENLVKTTAVPRQQYDQQRYLVEQLRAQVQTDEALIAYAKTQVEYTTIRSPITGRVGIRLVDQGNIVHAADTTSMLVITQLKPISVIFTVAASSLSPTKLAPGITRVPVVALAADEKTELDRGTVDLVDNQIDPTTGMIKLKANFPNEAVRLWPGDFVNGRIRVEVRRQGVTMPATALRHGPRGEFVWVVRGDDTVESRPVRAAQTFNGRTLLIRGVSSGERVVTDGHFLLENGRRVEIIETQQPPTAESQAAPDPG